MDSRAANVVAQVHRVKTWGMVAALGLGFLAIGSAGGGSRLPSWKAMLLGAVEGLTEFLPVSSTGHLLVVGSLLGLGDGNEGTPLATFVVAVQVGAIAAVVGLYRVRVAEIACGLVGRHQGGRHLLQALALAFVPSAAVGLVLEPLIKQRLFHPWAIVAAWAVGGLVLVSWRLPLSRFSGDDMVVSSRQAIRIGLAQVLALWPGTSRSLVTLVAGLLVGLTAAAAIEFSFLLGVGTLSAATAWDLLRHGDELVAAYGAITPLIGAVAAYLTAVVSVRWMISLVRGRSLRVFGVYRLVVAAATAGLLLAGPL